MDPPRPSGAPIPPSVTDTDIRIRLLLSRFEEVGRGALGTADLALELDALCVSSTRAGDLNMLLSVVRVLLTRPAGELDALHSQARVGTFEFLERLVRHSAEDTQDPDEEAEQRFSHPVGTRKFFASKPARSSVQRYLNDPDPRVTERVLRNPTTTEADVVRMVTATRVTSEVIRTVARSNWLRREHVRRSLILSRRTPLPVGTPILSLLNLRELREVKDSSNLRQELRDLAHEWSIVRTKLATAREGMS